MLSPTTYRTLAQPAIGEYKDKGSKFLAYVRAVFTPDDVRFFLDEIKELHPKATHHCYAYRLGLDKLQHFRANDDGEPSGSAGRPILGQIDSYGLSNVMVIVVRYYGGVKLGVPGLIAAYKTATIDALGQAVIEQRPVLCYYRLQFPYLQMNSVMQFIKREHIGLLKQIFDNETCSVEICFPQAEQPRMVTQMSDIEHIKTELLYVA